MTSFLIHIKMWLVRIFYIKKIVHDAKHPLVTQKALLSKILIKNALTDFGRKYGFSSIHSYEEFCRLVPICTYEDIEPFVERQIGGDAFSLTASTPVMYAQTSGTTGKAKYIPILKETIDAYKKAQSIFAYAEHRDVPGIFSGKILAIVSPAIEGYLAGGAPYGSMSGIVYENMPTIVRSKYVLPADIFGIADYDKKYLLIAAFAVAEENITAFASANPSTFLRVAEVISQHANILIDFVATGNLTALSIILEDKTAARLTPYCRSNLQRSKHLKTIVTERGGLVFSDLWPNLKAVVTWTSGNCALLVPALKGLLPINTAIVEMGYLSSEFRGTITVDCIKNRGLPTIQEADSTAKCITQIG